MAEVFGIMKEFGLLVFQCGQPVVVQLFSQVKDYTLHIHAELIFQIKEILLRDWNVSISDVYREANMGADQMSRMRVASSDNVLVWLRPPSSVVALLAHDALYSRCFVV
ncbi:Reverse transcriptase-like [Sesbania bispinosa]|nr:Reverse transcriptase-like [Sesbania bispinosa]